MWRRLYLSSFNIFLIINKQTNSTLDKMKVLAQLKALHQYDNFIGNQDGRESLSEYLKTRGGQGEEELIAFLNALDTMYQNPSSQERAEKLQSIMEHFIVENRLQLPDEEKQKLLDAYQQWKSENTEEFITFFDELLYMTHEQLSSMFKEYRASDDFQTFIWTMSHKLRRAMAGDKHGNQLSTSQDSSAPTTTDTSNVPMFHFDPKKPIISWSIEEVGFWLIVIGLGQLVEKFADEEIAGDVLLDMSQSDLANLGMDERQVQMYYNGIDNLSTRQERDSIHGVKAQKLVLLKAYNEGNKTMSLIPATNKSSVTLNSLWKQLGVPEEETQNWTALATDDDGDLVRLTTDSTFALMIKNKAKKNDAPVFNLVIRQL
jgi:hypothetical protein